MAHNNPGLTDLSDKYRPQKIGEHFSELYDNEWTEAVHQLTGDRDEEMAIQMIRDVLKVGLDTFCNFILSLERVVFLFNIDYIYFILSNDNFYDKDTHNEIRAHDYPI